MASMAAVINLLSIVPHEHHEVKLISALNKFFNFDHNIFLLDSSDHRQFIDNSAQGVITPQTVYKIYDTLEALDGIQEIQSKNTFLIIALQCINVAEAETFNLLTRVKEIQQFNRNIKIGLFSSQPIADDDLLALFEWCWHHRIINVFEAHRDETFLAIFTYNPFETFDLINLNGSATFDHYFMRQNTNFQQHPIQLRMTEKVWLSDKNVWFVVLLVMNASYTEIYRDYDLGPSDSLNSTIDAETSLFYQNFVSRVKMYPMIIDPIVVVVPEALPYSEFVQFLRTAISSTVLGYSLITVALVIFLLSFFRYTKVKRILFFQSVVDVVNLLLNDNASIRYQRLSRKEILLIVPLTFNGFMIVNCIVSYLQSYLTSAFLQPQINSIEEIYESSYPIIAPFAFVANFSIDVLNSLSNVGDFSGKIIVLDILQYEKELAEFNTSVSYLMTLSYAQNIIRFQKEMNLRGFHIFELHIYREIGSYNVNDEFPFIPRLNEVIDWVRSAGLYEKWCKEEFIVTEKEIRRHLKIFPNDGRTSPETFSVPQFILYGWGLSIIVFVLEIICKNFKLFRKP